jgi:hypothetical protein
MKNTMEANVDFSVVTVFYFLAFVAVALVARFHFPQKLFADHFSKSHTKNPDE